MPFAGEIKRVTFAIPFYRSQTNGLWTPASVLEGNTKLHNKLWERRLKHAAEILKFFEEPESKEPENKENLEFAVSNISKLWSVGCNDLAEVWKDEHPNTTFSITNLRNKIADILKTQSSIAMDGLWEVFWGGSGTIKSVIAELGTDQVVRYQNSDEINRVVI